MIDVVRTPKGLDLMNCWRAVVLVSAWSFRRCILASLA